MKRVEGKAPNHQKGNKNEKRIKLIISYFSKNKCENLKPIDP